jgi:hypothetical protein
MGNYFYYLKEILSAFFKNLGQWFYDRWAYPWVRVPDEFKQYGDMYSALSPSFGAGGWIMFVIFAILFIALIGAILFLIFWLIRKYVKVL